MDYEDSDWTVAAEQPAASPAPRWSPMSLMAGVVLGAVAASGVWWALAGPPAGRATAASAPHAAASAAVAPAPVPPAATVDPVATAGALSPASGASAIADADERKARAWARYYQRPASCEGNPSTEQLVECANHFIRSKRQFDNDWAAGRL